MARTSHKIREAQAHALDAEGCVVYLYDRGHARTLRALAPALLETLSPEALARTEDPGARRRGLIVVYELFQPLGDWRSRGPPSPRGARPGRMPEGPAAHLDLPTASS